MKTKSAKVSAPAVKVSAPAAKVSAPAVKVSAPVPNVAPRRKPGRPKGSTKAALAAAQGQSPNGSGTSADGAVAVPLVPIGRRLTERRRKLIAVYVDTKPRRYWKLRFPMR